MSCSFLPITSRPTYPTVSPLLLGGRQQQQTGLVGSAGFFQTLVLMCIFVRGAQPGVQLPLGPTNLVRVADLRTAVTGVPHPITVSVFLVTIGNFLAVVQDVFYSCKRGMLP